MMHNQCHDVGSGLLYLHDHDPVVIHGDLKGVSSFDDWFTLRYLDWSDSQIFSWTIKVAR